MSFLLSSDMSLYDTCSFYSNDRFDSLSYAIEDHLTCDVRRRRARIHALDHPRNIRCGSSGWRRWRRVGELERLTMMMARSILNEGFRDPGCFDESAARSLTRASYIDLLSRSGTSATCDRSPYLAHTSNWRALPIPSIARELNED